MIRNCLINPEYSVISNHIHGPAGPIIQGGMKRHTNPDKRVTRVSLPTDIFLHNKNIKLYLGFFLMNGMSFLHIKPPRTTFLTEENCNSKIAGNIIKEFNTVNSMYKARGFNRSVIHGVNELNLNTLREHIRPASSNICTKGRHIPIIKRSIQIIKQVAR